MLQSLINHNADFKRLSDDGFHIEICGGYVCVHHIPYITQSQKIAYGTMVCDLTLVGPTRVGQPKDHTMYFKGELPCHSNGQPLHEIINNSIQRNLSSNLIVNHYFSSKPKSGKYPNYYDKFKTYALILGSQAQALDSSVTFTPKKYSNEKCV